MSDDKRKFKISIKKEKTTGQKDYEKVEIGSIEVDDKHDATFEKNIKVGTGANEVTYKVTGKFKKGYMWDSVEDLDVSTTSTTVAIEPKSFDAKAEQYRWFPWMIPGIVIILLGICGAIWYFMYSGNEEKEEEEEGL